jgi:hypothetical protein
MKYFAISMVLLLAIYGISAWVGKNWPDSYSESGLVETVHIDETEKQAQEDLSTHSMQRKGKSKIPRGRDEHRRGDQYERIFDFTDTYQAPQ